MIPLHNGLRLQLLPGPMSSNATLPCMQASGRSGSRPERRSAWQPHAAWPLLQRLQLQQLHRQRHPLVATWLPLQHSMGWM